MCVNSLTCYGEHYEGAEVVSDCHCGSDSPLSWIGCFVFLNESHKKDVREASLYEVFFRKTSPAK